MSVNYKLKNLDVSKLPDDVRELLAQPTSKSRTPYHSIFYLEEHDKAEYSKGSGKDVQYFFLNYTCLNEDETPQTVSAYKTDEDGNDYKYTDDHIAEGFTCLKCDPSKITYPLEEFFESIKL